MSRIRVAVLGAGVGREHLRAWLALPDRFDVRTLVDLDGARAEAVLAAEAPGRAIRIGTDLDAALADPEIDLVDVCLPPHLHAEISIRALGAGKHVVCEKPLATSLAEVDAMLVAAEASGRTLTPVFQYRFGRATARLAALAGAGLTGRPFVASLETHWDRAADYYAVPWRGTWAGENGGAVLGHAIHAHDLLVAVMGPVESVSAHVATRVNGIEVEDCAAVAFRLACGAVATSSITLGAAGDATRLRFCFERLTAESGRAPYRPAEDEWTFTARDPADQDRVDRIVAGVGPVRPGFEGLFDALADRLTGPAADRTTGPAPRAADAADGRASIELVAAIYLAARSGRSVSLPLRQDSLVYSGWNPRPPS